jgi:hypothetical protein
MFGIGTEIGNDKWVKRTIGGGFSYWTAVMAGRNVEKEKPGAILPLDSVQMGLFSLENCM